LILNPDEHSTTKKELNRFIGGITKDVKVTINPLHK
jgi:hypothetical protein